MFIDTCRMGAALLTLSVLPANAERLALPDLAAPPQGSAQWIARSMRMNGSANVAEGVRVAVIAGRSSRSLRI